jgi:hypothetical protein
MLKKPVQCAERRSKAFDPSTICPNASPVDPSARCQELKAPVLTQRLYAKFNACFESWFKLQIVKQKSAQGHQEKVGVIIEKLVQDYAKSTSANHRKVRQIL